jgi:hypothetical protein
MASPNSTLSNMLPSRNSTPIMHTQLGHLPMRLLFYDHISFLLSFFNLCSQSPHNSIDQWSIDQL